MSYYYKTGIIVPFIQKFYKQMIVVVAALFIASMAAMTLSTNAAAPNWTANAPATITFTCGGTQYVHTLKLVNQSLGGDLTGSGTWNDNPTNYTWVLTGDVSGDTLDASILYTGTAGFGSVYELNGTIDTDGSVSGASSNGCQTFTMSAGSFTAYDADETEVDIYSSTTATENEAGKWWFNRDPSTATPYEFNKDAAVIGEGSLYVLPIANDYAGPDCTSSTSDLISDCNKFIGEYFAMTPIDEVRSFSYDFKIGAGGVDTEEEQFYLNVYANFGQSADDKFYDCRYNVVPTVGSTVGFTTVTFDPTQSYSVTTRGSSPYTCPTIPADMDTLSAGSNIRAFALNLGDTSGSDLGLDGYFDNVVFATTDETLIFDFEPYPRSAVITSPLSGTEVMGNVVFTASLNDDDVDAIQWAVRQGTCAAGVGTVFGNVDGRSDVATINTSDLSNQTFSFTGDMSGLVDGTYCFVYNPVEDAGESNIRLTSEFTLDNVITDKEGCKNGLWVNGIEGASFRNQGDCVSYFATANSAVGNNPATNGETNERANNKKRN